MNIAEYICNYIAAYESKYIFGYPGAAILPLMDAIEKHQNLEWVLMRHEASAAFAASAYAKLMQHISICMASSGPGATNLITGLLDAELDSAPVLIITGLIPIYKHSLSHFQDIDQTYIFKTCCGFSANCEHPMQVPQLLQRAIGYVVKNNKPAHLAIPRDIQLMDVNKVTISHLCTQKDLHHPLELMAPPDQAMDIVAQTLREAQNIIIAVGPRARFAGPQIEKLSEKLNAPIVCSFAGKGIINEEHENYFGVLGLFGSPANQEAMHAIEKAELVLAFGIDDIVHFLTDKDIKQKRDLIQCEPNITSINYQFVQKRILLGRLDTIALKLSEKNYTPASSPLLSYAKQKREELRRFQDKIDKNTASDYVLQKIFFAKLNKFINKQNTIVAFDIGDCVVWGIEYLHLSMYQAVLVSNKVGAMGFSLPAMIAAKLAKPDHLVVGICGDGGLQMVLGEINTAVQMNVNIIMFVFNNGVLQRVEAQQDHPYGTTIRNPNFEKLAKDCGASALRIHNNQEIDSKLEQAFAIKNGPVFVEIICSPNDYAPMIASF